MLAREKRHERRFTREEIVERVAAGKNLYADSHLLNATSAWWLVDELLRGVSLDNSIQTETGQVLVKKRATGELSFWVEVGTLAR
jgi:hypothetical protein